jgi:hypothetical protein
MHPSNSSKSGSDIDEADGIEVDWDDGPGLIRYHQTTLTRWKYI